MDPTNNNRVGSVVFAGRKHCSIRSRLSTKLFCRYPISPSTRHTHRGRPRIRRGCQTDTWDRWETPESVRCTYFLPFVDTTTAFILFVAVVVVVVVVVWLWFFVCLFVGVVGKKNGSFNGYISYVTCDMCHVAKKAKPETPPLRAVRTTDLHSIYSTDVVPSIVRSFRRKCTGSRTDTSYVSEFETPRLVGTYWYVRTYKPTTEIQDLPYVRFISTGKFPGLTRKVSGSHSLVRYPVQEKKLRQEK